MGIGYQEAVLLRYCLNKRKFGTTATIGRQSILSSSLVNEAFQTDNSINWGKWHEKLFRDKLGSKIIDTYDYSDYEGANKIFDLNKPINTSKKYDTVIDFGSSEHVFNVAQSLKNIIKLTKINGLIIHALPANNTCGHGLYQFSPELFLNLYSECNGFSETEVFVVNYSKLKLRYVTKLNSLSPGQRLRIRTKNEIGLWVITKKVKEMKNLDVYQKSYEYDWKNNDSKIVGEKKLSLRESLEKYSLFNYAISVYRYLGLNEIRHKITTMVWAYNSRVSKYGEQISIKDLLR